MSTTTNSKSQKWIRATRDNPCPACGKVRCLFSPDRLRAKCWRSGVQELWEAPDAKRRNGDGYDKPDPKPKRPPKTFTTPEAAMTEAGKWIKGGKLVATWVYPGDTFRVGRFNVPGDKTCRPVHRLPHGAWAVGDPPGLLPLYRFDELPPTGPVYVVEGEKCVDIMWSIGLPAVTSAHGADSPHKTDWTPLAERQVVIIPDADAPGRKYAQAVANILRELSCK